MRVRAALAIVLLCVTALTGCGQKHATIDDCVERYLELGKDPQFVLGACITIQSTMPPEEFDRQYGQ